MPFYSGCLYSSGWPPWGQNNYSVKGTVSDTVEKVKLVTSAVSILQSNDLIPVKFSYVKADGNFMLNGLPRGSVYPAGKLPGLC